MCEMVVGKVEAHNVGENLKVGETLRADGLKVVVGKADPRLLLGAVRGVQDLDDRIVKILNVREHVREVERVLLCVLYVAAAAVVCLSLLFVFHCLCCLLFFFFSSSFQM